MYSMMRFLVLMGGFLLHRRDCHAYADESLYSNSSTSFGINDLANLALKNISNTIYVSVDGSSNLLSHSNEEDAMNNQKSFEPKQSLLYERVDPDDELSDCIKKVTITCDEALNRIDANNQTLCLEYSRMTRIGLYQYTNHVVLRKILSLSGFQIHILQPNSIAMVDQAMANFLHNIMPLKLKISSEYRKKLLKIFLPGNLLSNSDYHKQVLMGQLNKFGIVTSLYSTIETLIKQLSTTEKKFEVVLVKEEVNLIVLKAELFVDVLSGLYPVLANELTSGAWIAAGLSKLPKKDDVIINQAISSDLRAFAGRKYSTNYSQILSHWHPQLTHCPTEGIKQETIEYDKDKNFISFYEMGKKGGEKLWIAPAIFPNMLPNSILPILCFYFTLPKNGQEKWHDFDKTLYQWTVNIERFYTNEEAKTEELSSYIDSLHPTLKLTFFPVYCKTMTQYMKLTAEQGSYCETRASI